jgi:hypothetical protein
MVLDAMPRRKAQVCGAFYAITIVASIVGLLPRSVPHLGHIETLVAGAAYLVVTVLLYQLLKPVNPTVSLVAAFFSIAGVATGDDSLFFFGFYCILIGWLLYRSSFFPPVLGVLMVLAGIGLLTVKLTSTLLPGAPPAVTAIAFALDGLGEIVLTLWLLVVGVDTDKWMAAAARRP